MQKVESFRDLIVWQRAMELTLSVYQLTSAFPSEEKFGLTSQLRRASVSVASNIAEGYGRGSTGEYKHFLGIARGSNAEVLTQLLLARELGFGQVDANSKAEGYCDEVARMLVAMMQKL